MEAGNPTDSEQYLSGQLLMPPRGAKDNSQSDTDACCIAQWTGRAAVAVRKASPGWGGKSTLLFPERAGGMPGHTRSPGTDSGIFRITWYMVGLHEGVIALTAGIIRLEAVTLGEFTLNLIFIIS